jgi:glycosyltransferase involved in cell wall biosynthesis
MPDHRTESSARLDAFVSAITVAEGGAAGLARVVRETEAVLARQYTNYELIIVDNGLAPDELTGLRRLLEEVPCVRVLRLSRHFAYDTAVFAGIEAAIGDYVVVFELERDPVAELTALVERLVSGADIVQGISTKRAAGSFFERVGRRIFYWYNRRALAVVIPERSTYFTAFTRRAVNSLLSSDRQYRYLRHLMRHIGYSIVEMPYAPRDSHGRSRGVVAGTRDGIEMITSYSMRPLRVISIGGLIAAAVNLVYAVYVVVTFLAVEGVERGWTTTNLQLSVMFFFLFLSLAVMSEYIGRLLAESRREPAYFVMEELTSDRLVADEARRNIV